MSDKQYVFGHKVPDTDAIVSAIAMAYFEQQFGVDVEAVALGEPNAETKFVLDYFDAKMPKVVEKALPEVEKVMLVDHNEPQQSISDIADLTVTHVVDHHRIADFDTSAPLYYRACPFGCTSTILFEMFSEEGIEIPKQLAGLMMSAIISDTLLLKSPTTTDHDRDAIKGLADIAGIDDYEDYGIKMLKAGTNVDARSDQDIIDGDAKSFDLGGKNVRIDQVNVVDLNDVKKRADSVKKAMETEAQEKGYDLFLVLVTNVLDSNSFLICVGEPQQVVEEAFDAKFDKDGLMSLPGVVSRKKQVVPPLTDALEK